MSSQSTIAKSKVCPAGLPVVSGASPERTCAGSPQRTHRPPKLRLILLLCGFTLAGFLPHLMPAQQINYIDFNTPQAAPNQTSTACPAGTNILFCVNYSGAGASYVQYFYPPSIDPNAASDGDAGSTNYGLQLTENAQGQDSSVWFATPQDVVDGFTTWYTFEINYQGGGDGNTADGLAFVIQNASGGKTDSISGCAETGLGPKVLGFGGGCLGYGGIDNSVALEVDTFFDSWDPQQSSNNTSYSDNHLALQSCGLDGNGNPLPNSPAHNTTPNCLISLSGTSTLITSPTTSVTPNYNPAAVYLADGNPHQIVMVYNGPNDTPANYLWVYLDATYVPGTHTPLAGSTPLFSGPFDITKYMKLSNGGPPYSPAYVGFTGATGGDYEQQELLGWTFASHAGPQNFGNVYVCPSGQSTPTPCNVTLAVPFQFTSTTTIGSIQVVTQGAPNLDFTLAGGSTCSGTVAAGGCTVNVTFAPLAPGLRPGAVNLFDNSGNLLATTLICGVGQGPAAAIGPGTQSTLNTGTYVLSQPKGLATDAAGDLYIADTGVHTDGNRNVLKIAPDGTRTTLGSGLLFPQGIAVDGAGDLFVADNDLNQVIKIPAGCTSGTCQQVLPTPQCVIGASGVCAQLGVAVDGPGNVFIASFNSEVLKVPANGGAQTVLYNPTGSQPVGIAVDAAGDLFITDFGLKSVVKVPAGCASSACQTPVGGGWNQPNDVAVDAAGDVFVTDAGLQQVIEVPAGCASVTCQIPVVSGITSGAVAVDAAGNLYIDSLATNTIVAINRLQSPTVSFAPASVGSVSSPISFTLQNVGNQPLTAESPGLVTVNGTSFVGVPGGSVQTPDCSASSLLAPGQACELSVSFEPQIVSTQLLGSVVFTDNALNATSATQSIFFNGQGSLPSFPLTVTGAGSGSGTVIDNLGEINCSQSNQVTTGLCAGSYSGPVTLTASAAGTSKFQGWGGACASAGTSSTCTLLQAATASVSAIFDSENLGSFGVCTYGTFSPCSGSFPVTFVLPATTKIGAINVVTQGVSGLDFNLYSGNTCIGTVTGGTPCNVQVTFAPLAPGLRTGAVELFDSNGNMMASQLIYGTGLEPEIAIGPGVQTVLPPTGYNVGVAVDAAGDTFVANYQSGQVLKYTPQGVPTTVPAIGLSAPIGVAVDGAGDLYIVDLNLPHAVKVTPSGVQSTLGSGLNYPIGIALDGSGNAYIGDRNNNRVVAVTPGGVQTTVPATGLNQPWGVAVDTQGDVFIADGGNSRVVKVTPSGVQTIVPATGLSQPYGVALDAAGDIYIADPINARVVEVPAGNGPQTTVGSGLNYPSGVTVDAAGSVLIGDQGAGQVFKVTRSAPPAISFATTNVGSTSADSPVAFSVQNVGNQPLTGSLALNLGTSFTQNTATDCSAKLPLTPGSICGESFSFTPQTATFFSGAATFTDNNLNSVPLGTQTIPLYGIGAVAGVAGTVAVPNVTGLAQVAAAPPITAVGLAMGTVTSETSSSVTSGSVIGQSPAAGTLVAVGSAVNLLVSTGIAEPPSPNPLSLENNYFVTGDYVSAGVTLHGKGVNGTATGSIIIPGYSKIAPIATQGVPDGADIVDAFLYWESLENTPTASSFSGTFNGFPILGQQIGNDIPSYKDGSLTGTLRAYRANVNIYLPVQANGIRIVSGTYTVGLPDTGGSTYPLTEGASLVLIYRVLSQDFPLKSVVLYDGAAMPTNSAVQVVQGFYDAVGGASGTGKSTVLSASAGSWNNSVNSVTLGQSNQYTTPLIPSAAYAAVLLSTPVNNSDNDGILDAWKAGPQAGDFHAGQPGYYDVKTDTWVGLPGAKHGQKDLFVQLDYMCAAILTSGSCDPAEENLYPSPDADGNDPLALVQQAFAQSGVQLHLQIGNAVPETTCTDSTATGAQLCQFPNQPGVIGWKNSLEFSKLYPRNLLSCLTGGDCTTRFPYGQKDSYHYVLFGHSLAIPAYNTRYATLTSINVANGVTTIGTVDRGTGINHCPGRITIEGVLGNPGLNGVYNTTGCADSKTITLATPGVSNWSYPNNNLPEPVVGITSGTITSISGYSDLGGADSAVTLGLWLTAPNQDMSKRANVVAGTLFHEIGHTLGLSHGGLYYDALPSYVPTFEANCKPNYQSIMNYLFQLDGVGPNQSVAFSNQTLEPLNESTAGSITQLTDASNNAATFSTSAWYVPYTTASLATPATLHCDGTPLTGDQIYRVDAPISPINPPWSNGQDLDGIGVLQTEERGFSDIGAMDLRQVGATGGEFASLATELSFGNSVAPLNISAGGNIALGSGGTVALGSGGTVTLDSGGNVTLGSGGTITLGSGGNVTLGSGGNVTLGSGGTITPGSGATVTVGSGGNVTLGSGGTITLGSGGTIALGSGGNVTLGSGGTIALGSGGTITVPSTGGSYSIDGSGGTITLGSGGNVTLGSGGNVTLGSGGTIALGSGGNVTLGSGGNVTLGSGGTIALGSGGNVTLGSGGNVTLGSGGTIALGSGGTVTLGSGGNVTLGSGGTVTLGSGGNVALGSGGNVTLGSGGVATLGAGGTVTLGSGGTVTLGSGGNVTLGSGGTIALGSGGTVTLGSGGNVTLGSGGTIALGSGGSLSVSAGGTVTLGSGGTVTLGSGGVSIPIGAGGSYTFTGGSGTVTLGSGGNVTLGSGGNVTLGSGGTIALGSGGTVTLGSGGNVTLGSGGNITMGSGGTVTLGSGGTVTLGSGGVVTLGSGGSVTLGTGAAIPLGTVSNITPGSGGPTSTELSYETANSVVRPPVSPTETPTPAGVRITWKAPAFGVVATYTIYRSSNGATPIVIGSVSGVNGNPPATEFTDTDPDLTSKTVVYTIVTTLVADTTGGTQRQSQQSAPAVVKNDQTIILEALPSSVLINNPLTVTATAMSSGVPNGVQVTFSATGACAIGTQSIAGTVSSASVTLITTGNCTITASQPGTNAFNAANAVSGAFMILPQSSSTKSQTINFPTLPNVQYGGSFSLSATSSAGLPVSFTASGPCTTSGSISGIGKCSITASAPASSMYSAASLTQTFTILPAVLKVTAANATSTYGQPLPSLTYSYSGFVNGDTVSVVGGAPAVLTTATSTSNAGSYPITVLTGTLATTNYSFLYVSGTLTVQPASQATLILSAASPLTYGQSETLNITGGSTGGAVTYKVTGGPCTVTGAQLTANSGTGACQVTATMAGNNNFNAVTSTANSVTLALAGQTITFTVNPPASAAYNGSFIVAANAGSGSAVVFTSSGACSNSGATYKVTSGTGTCSVIATQAGNANYAPATIVTKSVTTALATPTLTFTGAPASATYESKFAVATTTNASTTAAISASSACTNTGTAVTMTSGTGTCAITATWAADNNYTSARAIQFTIASKIAPTVTFTGAPASAIYQSKFTVAATTNASIAAVISGTGACTNSGAVVSMTSGTGTCSLSAAWAADSNYNGITAGQKTMAMPIAQAIAFSINPPASAAYRSSFKVAATGGASGNPVTLTSAGACGNADATFTMTNSTGTCSVIVNQAGNSNYAAAPPVTKTVSATGPIITLSSSSINFGTVYLNSISAQTIIVSNTGTASATINDPILSIVKGGNSNEFIALSLCPRSLAAGKSCTVLIGFIAGPFYTPQTATLQIMDTAPGGPHAVTLSASVIDPVASFSPASLSFGTVKHATSSTLNATLGNTGATPLSLTSIAVTGANATYFVETNTCGTSLAAGAHCAVFVKFTPVIAGTFTANLTVIDNAGNGTQTVALSGKGN